MPVCSPRVTRALIAAAVGLVVALGISIFSEKSPSAAVNRGDFPAFYTLAYLVANGEGQRLYDLELQRQVQNAVWPSLSGSVLPAAYPAYLGFFAQPLALLDVTTSRIVWVSFMLACVAGSAVVLARSVSSLRGLGWQLGISLFLFCPLLLGVIGAQVVGWSMLCYALLVALNPHRRVVTEALFGVVAAMLMVKPHYALGVVAIVLLDRRWIALGAWLTVSAALWGLGALVAGGDWLSAWLGFARQFSEIDLVTNAHQMTGIVPAGYSLARALGFGSSFSPLVWDLFTLLAACLVPIGLAIGCWIDRSHPARLISVPLLSLGPLLILCAPAVNFYDLSLVLIPLIVLFRPHDRRDLALAGCVLVASQLVGLGRGGSLPGVPFLLALAMALLWAVALARELSRNATSSVTEGIERE